MRMNKRLASTVLTGLFVTTCIFSPAEAQEQSFASKGGWALTKVDRSAEGGKSYCTLSRKYDDGVVLSLARNQAEEYSLAIDFQKDVFEKDKSLKINLQPGPGQIRAYDMMPSSQKAIVIRLGWDAGFFDTLNSSQQMKVKIGEQSYAFAMPEVAKGQSDLKGCMEELQTAAKGGEAAPSKDVLAAVPVVGGDFSAEKAGDKPSIAAAKADVDAKEQKVLANFAKDIKATEPSLNGDDESAGAKVAAAPVPPQKPKVPEVVKRPPSNDVAMASTLAEIEPASGADAKKSSAELKQMQGKLKDMTQETEALKKQTATDLTKSSEQVAALQKRLAEIAQENASLKQKSKTVTPQMQKELNAMADEQKQLEERLLFAEQEKAKLSVQQMEFADRAKQLEQRNSELEKSLRTAQQDAAQATAAVSTKSSEQLKNLQAKLSQIVAENEKLKVETASMDSIASEKKALEAKLVAAEKEKATLVPAENLASAEAKAKQLAEEKTKLEADMKAAQAKKDEEAKLAEAKAKQLGDEKAKLEADLKAAQAKKDEEAKLAAAKVGEDLKAMQDRIASITSENAALKQKAEGISPEAQKKIEAAEAEKKILQDKLALAEAEALKKQNTPAPETVKQLETLQTEKQALEAKFAAEQAAKKALEEKLAAANAAIPVAVGASGMTPLPDNMDELEKLKAENKALTEKLSAAETVTPKADENTKAQLTELEIRNKQLEDNLREAQARMTETAVNTESKALRQITELEMKLDAAQKDNLKIAKELEDLRTKREDDNLSLVSGDASLEQAVKRSNEAEREIRRLGQQVEKEKQQCSIQKAEIEQMLFDPAVTEEKQLEKLRSLEAELEQANAKILELGGAKKMASALQDISPAAGAEDMGSAAWSSATPPSVVAEPVADNVTGSADRLAAVQQRQLEDLKRQLERKQNESATYRNQLIAVQQKQNVYPESDSIAQRLSGIETSAGSDMAQKAPAAKPASKPGTQNAAYDRNGIQSLLQKAGLQANGLQKAASGMPGAENFGWTQGSVQGVASVRDAKAKGFDAQVKEYIAHQKSRCAGDFASMPSPADSSGKKMEMYEVACVGAQSKSSSIVFFEDKGRFVAIASQTDAADMDTAMDSRDKIASAVKGM